MYGLNDIGGQLVKQADCSITTLRRPSVMENLQQQHAELAARLANVDVAIKALEATPGVTDVLEARAKVNGY